MFKTIRENEYLYNIKRNQLALLDKLTGYKKEIERFYNHHGYYPNLKEPKSFSEKLLWKKLYDRNPLLPVTIDKYRVRHYIESKLGKEKATEILIPLLYVTTKPETIPFDDLPDSFIIKCTHGSGWNIIVDDNNNASRKEIINKCKRWLRLPYGYHKHEWAYQKIKRRVIIEELLSDENRKIPKDYKFYIFHGKCRLIHIVHDRFENFSRALFDRDWNKLNVRYKRSQGYYMQKPSNLDDMIFLAEELGEQFDFVRVDLYTTKNKIYFGELTHYPGSAMATFDPQSFDFELGRYW